MANNVFKNTQYRSKVNTEPAYTDRFRNLTKNETMVNVTSPTQHCHKCHKIKSVKGGKRIKGTSRWNPSQFYCADCISFDKQL